MPSGYWGGLVEGFQGRREAEYKQNYERELQNRQLSDRVFQYLLQSRDPQMQQMALQGMMEPVGTRQKGFKGFMGGVETNPFMAQVVSRMNEIVPPEPTSPTPPASPGAAAMSTNQPVRPGSTPIAMPGTPLPPEPPPALAAGGPRETGMGPSFADAVAPSGPGGGSPPIAGASGAPSLPPVPPPESPWKRRGTGVPTAEEIAEMNARVPLEARIKTATAQLQAAGATPEEIQDAIMGILGAPRNQRTLSTVTQWGVKLPGSEDVVPVLLDQNQGYVTAGGKPLPPGAVMVRMGGATAGLKRNIVPDPQSSTGYSAVYVDSTGVEQFREDTVYTPAPAYSGSATGLDTSGNPVIIGVPRQGVPGNIIAQAPNPQPSEDQTKAQALLAQVQDQIKSAETPRLPRAQRPILTPKQKDDLVRAAAVAAGLPYTTLFQLEEATRTATARQVTPRANAPQGTAPTGTTSQAERVRQRALQNRGGGAAAPPVRPPTRPTVPVVEGR